MSADNLSVLRAEGLQKTYKQRAVVKGSTLSVQQGECVGLLGPNGAGKTTTFYMITGMIKPDAGKVFINDTNITSLPMYKRARAGLAYLPQEASVFRRLTVEQNIMAVLQLKSITNAERRKRCDELLEEFGIHHIRKSAGAVLSGGERRRTEIARALATDPKFILLDEPFAGIDPIAVEEIMKIVLQLKHKGIGVLITDHNVHETLSITDRAYILIDGSIYIDGTAEQISQNPEVRARYLGETFVLREY